MRVSTYVYMCVCVYVCMCVCVHVCMCACVHECMYLCVCLCMQKHKLFGIGACGRWFQPRIVLACAPGVWFRWGVVSLHYYYSIPKSDCVSAEHSKQGL